MSTAQTSTSAELFEESFSSIREVLKSDRSYQLSKLFWEKFSDQEIAAAQSWLQGVSERFEQWCYLDDSIDLEVDAEFPLHELGTALFLSKYCRPAEMDPGAAITTEEVN